MSKRRTKWHICKTNVHMVAKMGHTTKVRTEVNAAEILTKQVTHTVMKRTLPILNFTVWVILLSDDSSSDHCSSAAKGPHPTIMAVGHCGITMTVGYDSWLCRDQRGDIVALRIGGILWRHEGLTNHVMSTRTMSRDMNTLTTVSCEEQRRSTHMMNCDETVRQHTATDSTKYRSDDEPRHVWSGGNLSRRKWNGRNQMENQGRQQSSNCTKRGHWVRACEWCAISLFARSDHVGCRIIARKGFEISLHAQVGIGRFPQEQWNEYKDSGTRSREPTDPNSKCASVCVCVCVYACRDHIALTLCFWHMFTHDVMAPQRASLSQCIIMHCDSCHLSMFPSLTKGVCTSQPMPSWTKPDIPVSAVHSERSVRLRVEKTAHRIEQQKMWEGWVSPRGNTPHFAGAHWV